MRGLVDEWYLIYAYTYKALAKVKSFLYYFIKVLMYIVIYVSIVYFMIVHTFLPGLHVKAVEIHKNLIDRFNNTPEYRTDLGITYLMINK